LALLETNWPKEFGVDALRQPEFFKNSEELDARDKMPSYAHVVRRAFRDLKLDGVLCEATGPIAYFRAVKEVSEENLAGLHRLFWNHGGAPLPTRHRCWACVISILHAVRESFWSAFSTGWPKNGSAKIPVRETTFAHANSPSF
jgi:hypothetical protein